MVVEAAAVDANSSSHHKQYGPRQLDGTFNITLAKYSARDQTVPSSHQQPAAALSGFLVHCPFSLPDLEALLRGGSPSLAGVSRKLNELSPLLCMQRAKSIKRSATSALSVKCSIHFKLKVKKRDTATP